jgi:hypothetical protein
MSARKLRVLMLFSCAAAALAAPPRALPRLALRSSAAAQVSGKLLVAAYKPEPAAAPSKVASYNWELENGFKEVRPDRVDARRELAIVLLGDGAPSGELRAEIPFSGGGLLPSTIAVRTGTTILFRNDDEIAHELFADGLEGFSAEAISPRGRRSVNVKSAGHWRLRDRVVTHVNGDLHVLPDLVAVGNVDASGDFTFSNVAPGKYTLKVFHGDKELVSQAVELGAKPLTVSPIALGVAGDKAGAGDDAKK